MLSTDGNRRNYFLALPATLGLFVLLFTLLFTLLSLFTTFSIEPKPFLKGIVKSSSETPAAGLSPTKTTDAPSVIETKYAFELDLDDYAVPKLDLEKLSTYPPHNYKGPGHPAFATFFITRNGSLHDPLFIAAQQLVYRLLWASGKKSEKYPVVVFVLPFVPDLQRQYFTAAGAIVREVEERAFEREVATLSRYRDQFAKLNMWSCTDFSSLLYLDADALPWNNLDLIFDRPEQRCKPERLPPQDARNVASICDYRFAAWVNDFDQTINAGVMLLQPNYQMYESLMREFVRVNGVDGDIGGGNEQGFLNNSFSDTGPFPRTRLSDEWNGGHEKGTQFYILHGKAWMFNEGEPAWIGEEFKKTWNDMLSLYPSSEFTKLRIEDRERALKKGG